MSQPTVVITGAGSGVGRAVAIKLAQRQWRLALTGRREALLQETARLTGLDSQDCLVAPADLGRNEEVEAMGQQVLRAFGTVDALVNAAGTNAPRRALEVLSLEDYHAMMDANLNGAYYCTQAFLPAMRRQGHGTLVHVVSDAGKLASPKAGPAYVMSKFGLAGLVQSINAEERSRGLRACAVFPGDIDTPLLDKRPQPPSAEARSRMLQPEDVADCILLALTMPERVLIEEIVVRPR